MPDLELTLNFVRQPVTNLQTLFQDNYSVYTDRFAMAATGDGRKYAPQSVSATYLEEGAEDPRKKFLDDPNFEPYGGWLGYGSGTAYAATVK